MNEKIEKNIERYFMLKVQELGGATIKMGKHGNPDRLAMFPFNLKYLVELKSITGKLSPSQEVVHSRLKKVGQRVYVIGSKDDVDWFIAGVENRMKRIENNYTSYQSFQ